MAIISGGNIIAGAQPRLAANAAGDANAVTVYTKAGVPTTDFNNVATPGSLCVDVTNKKLYINTGTLASNTWTVVGTQT